jgi:hypothetical protein
MVSAADLRDGLRGSTLSDDPVPMALGYLAWRKHLPSCSSPSAPARPDPDHYPHLDRGHLWSYVAGHWLALVIRQFAGGALPDDPKTHHPTRAALRSRLTQCSGAALAILVVGWL